MGLLLMDKLPPAVTETGVELVKAMVEVGPPLFVKEPRLSTLTVVAQELVLVEVFVLVSKVTMLFALVEVPIRTTVPLPA